MTLGEHILIIRKKQKLSQADLGKKIGHSGDIIGRYGRSIMTPSIETAKKLAKILDTTVGYLLGETNKADLFKDPKMMQRFQDISNLPDNEKNSLLLTVDNFIKADKINLM